MLEVTSGGVDASRPEDEPADEVWRYGIGIPFQVAPRKAGLMCSMRRSFAPTYDFAGGTDVILFDDISQVDSKNAIRLCRRHEEVDAETGDLCIMLKYPVIGGFVPYGAKRPDGSDHPHAGTGFGVSQVIPFNTKTEKFGGLAYVELYQFACDGDRFEVLGTEKISGEYRPGLTSAIPDGDDLLYPMSGDGRSGVTRWTRDSTGWHIESFYAVDGSEESFEPSLIRDTDGSLLMCARGGFDIRVWRTVDLQAWEQVVDVKRALAGSPVTLNQAADGTPYVAGNLHQEWFEDSRGVYCHGRELLCLWPLNAARNGVEPGLMARACRLEFGPPPSTTYWQIDHPSASTLQLADGQWHNVLIYRIIDLAESALCWCFDGFSNAPAQTGCYLEEVKSDGPPRPAWNF